MISEPTRREPCC